MKSIILITFLIFGTSLGITQEEINSIKKEAVDELMALAGNNPEVRSKAFRVQLDLAGDDISKLEKDVNNLVSKYPKMKNYWYFNLGQYFSRRNNHPKAMAYLGKIEENSNYFERSVLMIAETFFNNKAYDLAKRTYEKALKNYKLTESLQEYARLKLSWCDFNLGDRVIAVNEAGTLYNEAITIKDEALTAWKTFQVFDNTNPDLVVSRGDALFKEPVLQKETYLEMALAYDVQGNFKNSALLFKIIKSKFKDVDTDRQFLLGALKAAHREGDSKLISELSDLLKPVIKAEDLPHIRPISEYYYKMAKVQGVNKDVAVKLLKLINQAEPSLNSLMMYTQIESSNERINSTLQGFKLAKTDEDRKKLIEIFEEPYKEFSELLEKKELLSSIEGIYELDTSEQGLVKHGLICSTRGLSCAKLRDYSTVSGENQTKLLQAFTIKAREIDNIKNLKVAYSQLKKADSSVSNLSLALIEETETKNLIKNGQFNEAAEKYRDIASMQSESASKKASVQNAFYYFGKAGKLDEQINLVEKNNVNNLDYILEIADKLKNLGERQKAISYFEKAKAIDPSKKTAIDQQIVVISTDKNAKQNFVAQYPDSKLAASLYENLDLQLSEKAIKALSKNSLKAQNQQFVAATKDFENTLSSIKEINEKNLMVVENQWKRVSQMPGNEEGAIKLITGLDTLKKTIQNSPVSNDLQPYMQILDKRIEDLKGEYKL